MLQFPQFPIKDKDITLDDFKTLQNSSDLKIIEQIISSIQKNSYESNLRSALCSICKNESVNKEMIELVFKRIENLKVPNEMSPLYYLAKNPNITFELTNFLLEKGANFNHKTSTPFYQLCQNKNLTLQLIDLAIKYKADFMIPFITPFHLLCSHSISEDIIKLLLDSGLDFNAKYISGIDLICSNPLVTNNIIVMMLEKKYKFDIQNNTSCSLLFQNPALKLEMIETLIKYRVNLKLRTCSVLHYLCRNPSITIEMLKLLIKYGIRAKDSHITPLHYLCYNKSLKPEMIAILLQNNANINAFSYTPLHYLCQNPAITIESLELMIVNGANLKKFTYTPLSYLLQNESVTLEMIVLILKNGGTMGQFLDYGTKSKNEELKILSSTHSSFKDDFHNLFIEKQLVDFEISTFGVHKLIIEARTGKKAEEIEKILMKYTDNEIKNVLTWIYKGELKGKKEKKEKEEKEENKKTKDILKECGINNIAMRDLKEDIGKLYYYDDDDEKENKIQNENSNENLNENLNENQKDFIIEVEGKQIKAHKLVLAARSNLFRQTFILIKDDSNRTKDFTEKSFEAMNFFIKFLYTDQMDEKEYRDLVEKDSQDFDFDFFNDYYQLHPNSRILFFQELFDEKRIEERKKTTTRTTKTRTTTRRKF
ncbi:ankyrin repeat family protein [Anaeramoeba ignava]|uniref:Ankyrin repeat family protein n=1 Tax=Anaeramoeba ignava TaxID=1746090 RepID=A0A9Q0R486_ANAIG|nr:ankyrin repeat family protein [Anaeramoeba ignava]